MKNRKRSKKYLYIKVMIALLIVLSCALFKYTSVVQKIAVNQCFSVLDDSQEQIGQMIANEMKNEQGHLESAAQLLKPLIADYKKNRKPIVKVMEAGSMARSYAHWEVCFPDETGIKADGTDFSLAPKYSFEERIQKDFIVSERRMALKDDETPIVMLSECIFDEKGTCIGILSSVIDVEEFAQLFFNTSYSKKLDILLFDRSTGDILIDSKNEELGNIQILDKETAAKGYNWKQAVRNYKAGKSGHTAFVSEKEGQSEETAIISDKTEEGASTAIASDKIEKEEKTVVASTQSKENHKGKKENIYLSYAPVDYSDWELLVFAKDSVCMENANKNRDTTYELVFVLVIAFLIFFIIIALEEEKRYKAKLKREEDLKDALEKANQANAAKSDFLSRMSHDIRTPLNGIIGLLDISEANSQDLELAAQNRAKARIAANHLLSLINDILNMSKLEADNIELAHEAFDVRQLAGDILIIAEMRAAESGITLKHEDCSKNIIYPYVYGSPLHVRQIFVNILSNAIKYNKPGGNIFMKIESGKKQDNTIEYICTIADTGIGMSPEFAEHLFEPFSQEKVDARSVYHGTGLGMSIVKALVDKMNGSITVESELGVGSKFTVTLSFEIAEQKAVDNEELSEDIAVSIKDTKIMLVEDNELNKEIATELLKEQGAIVTPVANGAEAVRLFKNSPKGTFDVILMDVMMPVMDGLEATRKIRALDRIDAATIPIIALTANAFYEDVKKCIESGMNAHLSKPLEIEKVVEMIVKYTR